MGSKKTTTNVSSGTQTAAPPSWTMPGIADAASRVTQAIQTLPGTKYIGDFTALPNMADVKAAGDIYRAAVPQTQAFAQQIQQAAGGLQQRPNFGSAQLPTGTYNVGSGVDLNPAIQAALHPAKQQLLEQILPSIRSGAIESGAYSGSRALETLPGQAISDWGDTAARTAATIGYQDYNDREARRLAAYQTDTANQLQGFGLSTNRGLGEAEVMQQAAQLLPSLLNSSMAMQTAGGDLITQAAQLDQNARQNEIQNNLAKNQYDWMYPFQGLDIASDLLAKLSGGYGTTTSNSTSKTTEKTGGLGSVVQGIAGLASGAASLMGGPLGMAAGAAGGLTSGLAPTLAAMAPAPGSISRLFGQGKL